AVKDKFNYDDSLDAFGVHGAGGTLGALLTGVFATKEINDLRMGMPMGWVDGYAGQMINQFMAVLIAWSLAAIGTYVILKVCDAVIGIRADAAQEIAGRDLSMIAEAG